MLDPSERKLYINALRHPVGFYLDHAIATTFSLNLLTLLTVPLSFAKFDLKKKDDVLNDPVSILEAVRRTSGRFNVFCQNGRIKVPSSPNPLFYYLEKMIIEVSPYNQEGIFHPKVWVLRFVDEKEDKIFYRFLCLSRNITFDKSWDTILTLEGEVRGRFFARNHGLSDFIRTLPLLAKKNVGKRTLNKINKIAEEIRHVDFKAPDYYEDFRFWPMGIAKKNKFPIRKDYLRMLVVSPFLTNGLLKRLAKDKSENILISRIEELDALKRETLNKFEKIYVMDEAAEDMEDSSFETSSEASKKTPIDEESDLSGLHAKLFLAESGWDAYLWTGSANATSAAFDNFNVEFLVELKGKKSRVGIDTFIKEKTNSFMDLLAEYIPPEEAVEENKRIKELKMRLEKAQKQISNANLTVKVSKGSLDKSYKMELIFPKSFKFSDTQDISGSVWPISLKFSEAKNLKLAGSIFPKKFDNVFLEQITGFFAFKLKIKSLKDTISFVLNLPVIGMPKNREERILQVIISDKENFIRYLLLLLYDHEYSFLVINLDKKLKGLGTARRDLFFGEEMPLFEELVKAYSRSPEKINRITKLVKDLSKTEEGMKVLPKEFKLLWDIFQGEKK